MNDFFRESLFAGVTLSLLSYFIGSVLKKKFKLGIFNPLLISIIITIIVLAVSGVDYDVYNQGARYLAGFLHRQLYVLQFRCMSSGVFLRRITRQLL